MAGTGNYEPARLQTWLLPHRPSGLLGALPMRLPPARGEQMSVMKDELALAGYVALRVDDWEPERGCPAWIESADKQCGRAPIEGTALCKRHRSVAVVRRDKALAAAQHRAAERVKYRAKMLPEWRAELTKVESDMERYGGAPTTDRAAYGGAAHASIQRQQLRQLSDTNVRRMAKLSRRAQELRDKIGAGQ